MVMWRKDKGGTHVHLYTFILLSQCGEPLARLEKIARMRQNI